MTKENKDVGVITEQGFVEGNGLGYIPIKEEELNKNTNTTEEE